MVREKHLKNMTGLRTSFSDAERRPKKDIGYLMLVKSENQNFSYEVYDYRGIFVGYMGEKKILIDNINGETEASKEN